MIYPFRPQGCKIYPLVINQKNEIVVDDVCPDKDIIRRLSEREIEIIAKKLKKLIEEIY